MKKIKFLRYLNHEKLTGGVQRLPDEVIDVNDKLAKELVATGHAEYVPEPMKPKVKPVKITEEKISMDDYELADYDEVVP